MSATIALYKLKASSDLSDKSFTELLKLLKDMLPEGNHLSKNTYAIKALLKPSKLEYVKIDACKNDCCLFCKNNEDRSYCPTCGESIYK